MDLLSVILIAVGLAMDCFAVSTVKGVQKSDKAFLMAVFFGLFQGGMPLIGYAAGSAFAETVNRYDHWIALVLLVLIGGKMIWESRPSETEMDNGELKMGNGGAHVTYKELIMLAVATSIDALATGVLFVSMPFLQVMASMGIIAAVSFFFSRLGYRIGSAAGRRLNFNVELLGGLVLIGLGVKIFAEGVGWL